MTSRLRGGLHELYPTSTASSPRRAEHHRHLDDCPPCLEAYDFEAELRQVVAPQCREQVPDTLMAKVRAALAEEQASGTSQAF